MTLKWYGFELADIKYNVDGKGVSATFINGDTVTGGVMVGSDGPRSKVREILLGAEKASTTHLDIIHANISVKYDDAEKAKFARSVHPVFGMACHPTVLSFISSKRC